MAETPAIEHRYESFIFDSARWEGFEFRPDDILICTSYKAGTTWTQMICALLIFQTPGLPARLSELSRWLDMRLSKKDKVFAAYDAQTHRRFIKTHTPLDGLPYRDDVEYVFCGRDPRDVFMSMQHHITNMNMEKIAELLLTNGEPLPEIPPPPSDDINERFKVWMTQGTNDWEEDGMPFWSHFRHAQTFWRYRHLPNIHFLHYADLKADLEGEMRRLAAALGIEVPEEKWPMLVKAATFKEMKANADLTAPDTDHDTWISNKGFFNKGTNNQWQEGLSQESQALYGSVSRDRYELRFLNWLEKGSLATVRPEELPAEL